MPRRPRVFFPNVPCHVVSRGNNRDACFYKIQDYLFYLECLYQACEQHKVKLHAYVLMTNHVHLLMSPSDNTGISKTMQSIGRRFTQNFNKRYRRTGTLWEGRFKSSLVDEEPYLLSCYRYIEMNPVRAKMVAHPLDYQWSSYKSNAGINRNKNLTPHDLYNRLGQSEQERSLCYRELFATELDKKLVHDIHRSSTFSLPLGNSKFKQQIENNLSKNKSNK